MLIEFFMQNLYGGLLNLSPLGYVLTTLVMLQISMMAVTLYLHRDAAHRSLDLHPVLRHIFRFWIWCTSGMLTREWVAMWNAYDLDAVDRLFLQGPQLSYFSSEKEGLIPALESAHAVAWVVREAPALAGKRIVINLSGRGDKDLGILETA